ncbi:tyrosine-type recombinase/integrase [Bradyrhizobium sp. CCGUVB14]|uniref:tyrosine-type recombinase/integrase n=1 Tax=Bradyrhizobium sp. CCGUVB14 TaxID=2949628 RepID=UPI0020B3006A|nr:tyrosine-type recombinase/integrase [Bradyrhizobium sp. CCGUVB14]MCP3447359.1 tyrosine-type recombinase/integrase [Bradyrhizobium sp. CCGUVB14]
MPDFLTRRNGTWHFVRRVPAEFSDFDKRGIVRHSTKVRVSSDRTGRRAIRVAERLNDELEAFWSQCAIGADPVTAGYEEARRRARSLGFEYVQFADLMAFSNEKRWERLDALLSRGLENDATARTALLGTQPQPSILLSKLFAEYEELMREEIEKYSPNQLKVWRNGRSRVVKELVDITGDKPVTELSDDDGLDYVEWYRERAKAKEVEAGTANKSMGMLSRMLKEISVRRRLKIPEIFKGLRLRAPDSEIRRPFETGFIQSRLLADNALEGLNEDARLILYTLADTGMRPSELVNLLPEAIHLDAPIPYVEIKPVGRVLKTKSSKREIPLVGAALAAMKLRPDGFPRYRDKSSSLSATLNKYLLEHNLRPTKDHTVYSLRHSFKDRLVAARAPDSLIDSLMGHKRGGPRYGDGPPLSLKLEFLESIAFKPPSRL